jgi:hypothetical protein
VDWHCNGPDVQEHTAIPPLVTTWYEVIAFVPELVGDVQLIVTAPLAIDAEIVGGAVGATPLLGAKYNNRFGEPTGSIILFDVDPLMRALATCECE